MVAIMARDQIVKVVLGDEEVRAMDRLRVNTPRSVWLRELLRTAAIAARVLEEASSDAEGAPVTEQAGPAPVDSQESVRPAASPRASVPAIPGLVRGSEVPARPVAVQPRPIVQKRVPK